MTVNENILKTEEKIMLALRELYHKSGYTPFKMSRFEEYDLYAENKSFLVSGDILTFTDLSGRLMALKPDVTLSIIKNYKPEGASLYKVYYNENVYRPDKGTREFKEIMQSGIECIGKLDLAAECEVIALAVKSLKAISEKYILDISSVGMVNGLLEASGVGENTKKEINAMLEAKNSSGLREICEKSNIGSAICEIFVSLCAVSGKATEKIKELERLCINREMSDACENLKGIITALDEIGLADNIYIDFSILGDTNYYNGVVFRGYVDSLPKSILYGGRYDNLISAMKKEGGAIGFAVYSDMLDMLEKTENSVETDEAEDFSEAKDKFLNVALPKGRLGEKVYNIFEKCGYGCPSIRENNRKLIFEDTENRVRYFWVKPSDVAIYVERGAADIGVAGKDILLEYSPDVYELCDLRMGNCRMAVAGKNDFCDDKGKTLRVATKFPNIAKKYYGELSRDIDIIKLNGSIEIAPILGLSDVIVDIVETGTTLKENNLRPFETIIPISARLVSNKASYKFKNEAIARLCVKIDEYISDGGSDD